MIQIAVKRFRLWGQGEPLCQKIHFHTHTSCRNNAITLSESKFTFIFDFNFLKFVDSISIDLFYIENEQLFCNLNKQRTVSHLEI